MEEQHMYKIGRTTDPLRKRLRSYHTGNGGDLKHQYVDYHKVQNTTVVEGIITDKLKSFRENCNKEVYIMPREYLKKAVANYCKHTYDDCNYTNDEAFYKISNMMEIKKTPKPKYINLDFVDKVLDLYKTYDDKDAIDVYTFLHNNGIETKNKRRLIKHIITNAWKSANILEILEITNRLVNDKYTHAAIE